MTRSGKVGVGVAAALVIAAAAAVAVVRLRDRHGNVLGGGAAAGVLAGRAATWLAREAPSRRLPARCLAPAAEPLPDEEITAGRRVFHRRDGRLTQGDGGGAGTGRLRIGVVADARGATTETLANAAWARAEFDRAGVDVIVALGGMGATREEIASVLEVLASDRRLVVALPGDREPASAHEEAVAALRARELPVVDGAAERIIVVGGVAIGSLPGVAVGADGRAHGLVAGMDGCGRTGDDTDALAAALAGTPARARVLLSHAPPRQRGAGATDVADGGVHIGDATVGRAARAAGATLVVHGLVDEAGGRAAAEALGDGPARPLGAAEWGTRVTAAAGALEAAPVRRLGAAALVYGGAIIVDLDEERARVTPLTAPVLR